MPFFLESVGGIGSLNQGDGIHPGVEGTKIVAGMCIRRSRQC